MVESPVTDDLVSALWPCERDVIHEENHGMRSAHQFTMRQVQANGVRFALIDEGDGPAVLMRHGIPDTADCRGIRFPLVSTGASVSLCRIFAAVAQLSS